MARKKYLKVTYAPSAMFSLRVSDTTTKGAKTHLCPTPHCVKCALISRYAEAHSEDELVTFFERIEKLRVFFVLPDQLVVNQGFYTQLKPSRGNNGEPFSRSIMYKEYVYYHGDLSILFDVSHLADSDVEQLLETLVGINYYGKKDSLVAYKSHAFVTAIPEKAIVPLSQDADIFGLILSFDDLYSERNGSTREYLKDLRDRGGYGTYRKRDFIQYVLPYAIRATSRNYTLYQLQP